MVITDTKALTWADENPFYLFISPNDNSGNQIVDLGSHGWATTFADLMRAPGVWRLCHKATDRSVFALRVEDGDQPYYTARHVGIAGGGGTAEVVAYGIGKKLPSGETVRLWLLPDGTVCGAEDVDDFGTELLKVIGPR